MAAFGRTAARVPEGLDNSDGRGTRPPCLQPNRSFLHDNSTARHKNWNTTGEYHFKMSCSERILICILLPVTLFCSAALMEVYTEYDPADPPPHPGPAWTRFICISDTHSRTLDIPPGDALLHAGDLSSWGYVPQLETTVEWLAGLPHPIKMYVSIRKPSWCVMNTETSQHDSREP